MKRIILITGGQRSGKSTKAEELALSLSAYPVYVATAHIWDEEFRERVRRHQERRGPQWTNIEEEMYLSRHDMTGKVVVIDCVTLWLTNFFFSNDSDVDKSMDLSKAEFDAFTAKEAKSRRSHTHGLRHTHSNKINNGFYGWNGESSMKVFNIPPIDRSMKAVIQEKIDNLNKPKGSLGRLEELAMQICLIQQTLTPSLDHPCHLLLGGDHGIEREGVSVSPREVTWQQMINFTRDGGGVNMFCRQHGFKLRIVDAGVDYDLSAVEGIINRKIARGTKNFLYEPAMSEEEFNQAIQIGSNLVDDCYAEGCHILSIGEMGIANTSPSSIWMHLFGNIPLKDCIGAGAGLDTPGIRHKFEVLSKAVEQFNRSNEQPIKPIITLRYFGGFEMIAAIGAMLRAAELHLIILIDGFIMTACALATIRLYPASQDYMIFTHCGDESGHQKMLDIIGAKPLLHLGLRLGEGTGALCAFPIIDSAVRMMNEMNNFQNANITKYF